VLYNGICRNSYMRKPVHKGNEDDNSEQLMISLRDGNHFKFASHLFATLKKCLDDLKSSDQLLFSMTS
ncbi:Hypothetical predicted protein, partial [Paramuricea clavata]